MSFRCQKGSQRGSPKHVYPIVWPPGVAIVGCKNAVLQVIQANISVTNILIAGKNK